MRNLAVQMYMPVDGVIEAPENWSFDYWTDDCEKYAFDRLLAADARSCWVDRPTNSSPPPSPPGPAMNSPIA